MMVTSEERQEGRAGGVKTIALAVLLSMILLFALGVVAGAIAALLDGSSSGGAKSTFVITGAVAVAAAAALGLLRLRPWARTDEPVSARTRKANNLVLVSGLLGGVIGAGLSIGTISTDEPFALFSNSPMAPALVIPVVAVWLLLVPLISWRWHRTVDEHEAGAYRDGGMAALYLFSFLTPAWWLAARGGLLPPPDAMILFLAVMGIWGAGWLWRRYH